MSQASSLSYRQNPWTYFFLFLITNTLISYSLLSAEAKCLFGLLGIFLPLYVAFRTISLPSHDEKLAYLNDFKWSIPIWLGGLAGLALVFLRFYRLETLFRWPTLDEGWNGTLALELSRHWSWKFFYTFGQAPPLPIWCAALLLKLGYSPAFSLWFPSAVISFLTVIVGYLAAQQFFSKSFSIICGGLLAFSYWPLFIGRFCHQGIWLPLWVCLVFFFWGGFQKTENRAAKKIWAIGLGLSLGLGSFTFTPWLGVAGIFFISIFWKIAVRSKKDWVCFFLFTAAFFMALIPFLLAVIREGYGQHILSLTPWGGWFHQLDFFSNFFRYFAVLVWDSFDPEPAYTPLWGGFLNPLLGAFFFIGLIEMVRLRRQVLVQWVGVSFLLFLLPGALSPNLEAFRVAQILPLLLFITALGIQSFLETRLAPRRFWFYCLLLLFSGGLDFYLLTVPYQNPDAYPENFGRPLKSLERYRAYQILDEVQKAKGPGFVLTHFDINSFNDPTLSVMTYPFNAASNPSLFHELTGQKQSVKWLAIFVNVNYEPFLKKRFPEGEWFIVSRRPLVPDGGDMLGVFSITPQNAPIFYNWCGVHEIFQAADRRRFLEYDKSFSPVVQILETASPAIEADPFLESVYWDKRASYEYADLNYDQQLYSYKMAVTAGYPTADLYYKLGELLRIKGRLTEAEEAYLKATQAPLDLTPSTQILAALKTQEKIEKGLVGP